jgi:hypothetical protein
MSEEQWIYLGPSFPKGALRHGAVYIGGLPPMAAELRTQIPALRDLFVPVRPDKPEVGKARVQLKDPNSRIAGLHSAVSAWLRGDARRRHARALKEKE